MSQNKDFKSEREIKELNEIQKSKIFGQGYVRGILSGILIGAIATWKIMTLVP